jgi:hypothetical protein
MSSISSFFYIALFYRTVFIFSDLPGYILYFVPKRGKMNYVQYLTSKIAHTNCPGFQTEYWTKPNNQRRILKREMRYLKRIAGGNGVNQKGPSQSLWRQKAEDRQSFPRFR